MIILKNKPTVTTPELCDPRGTVLGERVFSQMPDHGCRGALPQGARETVMRFQLTGK